MDHHLLTFMIFAPAFGAVVQAILSEAGVSRDFGFARTIALGASILSSLLGFAVVLLMQSQTADLQMLESFPWIGSYAITYEMGIDGLNALLVLAISIVFPILIGAEWNERPGGRGIHGLLLLVQTALLGTVCAQDLFLLFFFWALAAVPFYFLIGIWGGPKREAAAFRAIVASALGNALLFSALMLIYYSVDPHTFSIHELLGGKLEGKTFQFLGQDLPISTACFVLVSLGLALRAPIWPIHGWFTQVANEAPLSVFAAFAAAVVPVAAYIFIRICFSLFPETTAHFSVAIVWIGVVGLVIGSLCAIAQRGLRLLMAYLTVAELGMLLIGIGSLSSAGLVGAVFQQFAMSLGLAGFGLITGIVIQRTGTATYLSEDGTAEIGGVSALAPGVAVIAGIVVAAWLGFPGLSGFVGRSLLLVGSFDAYPAAVLVAGTALLLMTYCFFAMFRNLFFGKPGSKSETFADLSLRERLYLVPLVLVALIFGIYPTPLIELIRPTVLTLLSTIK